MAIFKKARSALSTAKAQNVVLVTFQQDSTNHFIHLQKLRTHRLNAIFGDLTTLTQLCESY